MGCSWLHLVALHLWTTVSAESFSTNTFFIFHNPHFKYSTLIFGTSAPLQYCFEKMEHSLIQTEYGWQGIVKSRVLLGWELSGWEVLPGREELPGRVLCAEWRKGVVTRWWGVMSAICLSKGAAPRCHLAPSPPPPWWCWCCTWWGIWWW